MEETINNTQGLGSRVLRWIHDSLIVLGCTLIFILTSVFWGGDFSWKSPWDAHFRSVAEANARVEELEAQLQAYEKMNLQSEGRGRKQRS